MEFGRTPRGARFFAANNSSSPISFGNIDNWKDLNGYDQNCVKGIFFLEDPLSRVQGIKIVFDSRCNVNPFDTGSLLEFDEQVLEPSFFSSFLLF